MVEEKKVVRKKIAAAADVGKFMADYYLELDAASKKGDPKIAWCTSVGPAEILRAMGFLIYFPETHSAMLGATRMATDLIPEANALGYSPEICSYLTADIGAYVKGVTPLAKVYNIDSIPKPDVLVYNTNQCRDVQDWFEWYGKKFSAPVVGIHTHRNVGDVTEAHIESIAKQMEALIEPLEKVTGKEFEMDKLKEAVRLSRDCSDIWKKILDTASATPAPLTFFDGTTLMGPAVVGRGTQKALDVFEKLLAELEERIQNGEGAVEEEKHRIYWDGMPVWGTTQWALEDVCSSQHQRAGFDLLQQLDFFRPGSRRSFPQHGQSLHGAFHCSRRCRQRKVHKGDARVFQSRRGYLP